MKLGMVIVTESESQRMGAEDAILRKYKANNSLIDITFFPDITALADEVVHNGCSYEKICVINLMGAALTDTDGASIAQSIGNIASVLNGSQSIVICDKGEALSSNIAGYGLQYSCIQYNNSEKITPRQTYNVLFGAATVNPSDALKKEIAAAEQQQQNIPVAPVAMDAPIPMPVAPTPEVKKEKKKKVGFFGRNKKRQENITGEAVAPAPVEMPSNETEVFSGSVTPEPVTSMPVAEPTPVSMPNFDSGVAPMPMPGFDMPPIPESPAPSPMPVNEPIPMPGVEASTNPGPITPTPMPSFESIPMPEPIASAPTSSFDAPPVPEVPQTPQRPMPSMSDVTSRMQSVHEEPAPMPTVDEEPEDDIPVIDDSMFMNDVGPATPNTDYTQYAAQVAQQESQAPESAYGGLPPVSQGMPSVQPTQNQAPQGKKGRLKNKVASDSMQTQPVNQIEKPLSMLRKPKIVFVCGSGRIGVSTLVASLGYEAALKGCNSLIVDLDLKKRSQSCIYPMDLNPGDMRNSGLFAAIRSPHLLSELVIEQYTNVSTLGVSVSVDIEPEQMEEMNMGSVQALLLQAMSDYNFIIVDMPWETLVKNPQLAAAAHDILYVTSNDMLSIIDDINTYSSDQFENIHDYNLVLSKMKFIMNMVCKENAYKKKAITPRTYSAVVYDLTENEGLRNIPVIGYIPMIPHIGNQASIGRPAVSYSAELERHCANILKILSDFS